MIKRTKYTLPLFCVFYLQILYNQTNGAGLIRGITLLFHQRADSLLKKSQKMLPQQSFWTNSTIQELL